MVLLLLGACGHDEALADRPNTPGWTGRTVVIGNNSTIAADAAATESQQKWPLGRGR